MDKRGVWDPDSVQPAWKVEQQAERDGVDVHFGRLHELVMQKHAELDEIHRKWKGRVVFLGDQVRDQFNKVAAFSDMASQPATMEASAVCDYYGLLPGHDIETADAK